MDSKARVMVIALDAADQTLLRELARAGELPAIAQLMEDAAAVDTVAPEGVFVSANWPTIVTASSPERHGYLSWDEIVGGTYDYRMTTPTEVRGVPFWRRLSEAGRRVAVIDVPHSVVEPLNGVMLAEWGCHDRHFGTTSWPPELARELSARHGAHYGSCEPPASSPQFAPCDFVHRAGSERTDAETVKLFETICDSLERKRKLSVELLDRGGWDLFFTVIGESHCVGHQLWHLHDPTHPRHDPALARRLGGDPVREIYRRLDGVVAAHLDRIGAEDTAYLLLAHGMTVHNDGTHLLDQVLHRLDWGLDNPVGLGKATRAAAELARFVPGPLRPRALRAAAPLVRARAADETADDIPARDQRRWFQSPNNTVVGSVRLNLAGREPLGRVHPGDQRAVLDWLSQRLVELVNLETGGAVVRCCTRTDEVYERRPDDAFGDLFVEWERSAPIERVWSPATGTVSMPYEHWRQGDHVPEGVVFARGPGIRGGSRRVHGTADLGATFAAALGVSLPEADGRPIDSILPAGQASHASDARASSGFAARLGRLVTRAAERRVPAWARRQDPSIRRVRDDLLGRAEAAQARADAAHAGAERAELELSGLALQVGELERHTEREAMRAWLPHAEVPEELLISVVMPTRDRRPLLEQAIASVQGQSYSRWELLVVDDGSEDDTAAFLASIEDPRVRVLHTDGRGPCAARNAALDAAEGELISYLDDDNRFDPNWLRAVASTFAALPDHRVCYGTRVFDDEGRALRDRASGKPGFQLVGWDPKAIRRAQPRRHQCARSSLQRHSVRRGAGLPRGLGPARPPH